MPDFFQQPDSAQPVGNDPMRMRQLAQMLMKQGGAPQAGQVVGGQFVPPSPLSYVGQLAGGLGSAFQNYDAGRARNVLNGG